ncbi:hypothetical protein LCGC14_0681320 [marine sediment metagenome]|uniref:Terminase large subunit gp17-like C-terminal domain-containing protein n=1 Tax=marine sediment metagenome TaxID=412755 RepID=A0A0F9R8F0_9ZZZZ
MSKSSSLNLDEASLRKIKIPRLRELLGDEEFTRLVQGMTEEEAEALLFDWPSWARETQLEPPGKWAIWLVLSGRGFGKTRAGTEWVRENVMSLDPRKHAGRIALIAQTAGDGRDVLIEGEAGILAIHPKHQMPKYEVTKRRITWPNGAIATIYSAEDPDQLRGPTHDLALVDELAAYPYPDATWSNLMFGLRAGRSRVMATTTPRPIQLIKDLVAREGKDVFVTRGSTYDNFANLSETFKTSVIKPYEGTRLARQELLGEILWDVPAALWNTETLEKNRRSVEGKDYPKRPNLLRRVVVSVDPSISRPTQKKQNYNEPASCGIVVGGIGHDEQGYLLSDKTIKGAPAEWARVVIQAYNAWDADFVIAEGNNGGEIITDLLHSVDSSVPVKIVYASKGKLPRAEPVSALDEQGLIHLVGSFPELEDELTSYDGSGTSPNRLDAYVWLFHHLMVKSRKGGAIWGSGSKVRRSSTIQLQA